MTGRGWAPTSNPSSARRQWAKLGGQPHLFQPQRGVTGGTYPVACPSSAYLMCMYSVNPHRPFMGKEVPSSPLYRGRNRGSEGPLEHRSERSAPPSWVAMDGVSLTPCLVGSRCP